MRVLNETDVFRGNYNEASYVCHPLIKKQANKQVQLKEDFGTMGNRKKIKKM